jgi:magnesium-transporting ATPase (P-type)
MFSEYKWSDVKCGDIILVKEGEYFPADAILLESSAKNDECFV